MFVTVISAPVVVPTTTLADAVLLAEFGSTTEELTVTEFVTTVPFAVPVVTFTTIVNAAEVDPAMSTSVQITLPVFPPPGDVQVHPAGAVMDTNVVLAGTDVTSVALSAALGPLLVTTCV